MEKNELYSLYHYEEEAKFLRMLRTFYPETYARFLKWKVRDGLGSRKKTYAKLMEWSKLGYGGSSCSIFAAFCCIQSVAFSLLYSLVTLILHICIPCSSTRKEMVKYLECLPQYLTLSLYYRLCPFNSMHGTKRKSHWYFFGSVYRTGITLCDEKDNLIFFHGPIFDAQQHFFHYIHKITCNIVCTFAREKKFTLLFFWLLCIEHIAS